MSGEQKLTKKQQENIKAKFRPVQEKRYLVTDQCFWEQHPPKDYNPLDPKRTPHHITLVDVETGSMVMLKSGSIVQVIEPVE